MATAYGGNDQARRTRVRMDQARPVALEELRARRAMVEAARGRRRRRRRAPRLRQPRSQEARYRMRLAAIVDAIERDVEETILPLVERLAPRVQEARPDSLEERVDAPADDIRAAMERLRVRIMEGVLGPDEIARIAEAIGRDVTAFNRADLDRVFEATIGVGLPGTEPGLTDLLRGFVADNVRLLGDLGRASLDRVEGAILRGFRRGQTNATIGAAIQHELGVSKRRARLIARDQVASLNGELTQIRQTRMGVEEYVWRTVGDERVRPAHEELDGRRFRWDDPPPEGHPGEPINCRCVAEPVLDPIFDGL